MWASLGVASAWVTDTEYTRLVVGDPRIALGQQHRDVRVVGPRRADDEAVSVLRPDSGARGGE